MFEAAQSDLLGKIDVSVRLLNISESLRVRLNELADVGTVPTSFEAGLIASAPDYAGWRTNDQASFLTRLYSSYEVFILRLVEEVVDLTASVTPSFAELTSRTRRVYRQGFGRVLLEIEEKSYHRSLKQVDIVESFLGTIRGDYGYKLLPQAFMSGRRALRYSEILTIFADLGIQDFESLMLRQPAVDHALYAKAKEKAADLAGRLSSFIELRNESAHSEINNVIPLQEAKKIAYFVRDFCLAVQAALEENLTTRQFQAGQYKQVSTVKEVYGSSHILIADLQHCRISVDMSIILARGAVPHLATIRSIQVDGADRSYVDVSDKVEVGVLTNVRAHKGDVVYLSGADVTLYPVAESTTELEPELFDTADSDPNEDVALDEM